MTDADEPPDVTTPEFSPDELELILAEIAAIRAEMKAGPSKVEAPADIVEMSNDEIGLCIEDDDLDLIAAVCNQTPAEILADHERRILALERKLS